jgi:hypothetical protein
MSLTLNAEPVIVASLHLPLNGAWSAELQVSSDVELATGDAVTLGLPGDVAYIGRVVNAGVFGARLHVRVTGSASDWGQAVSVKHYRNTDGDQALRDLGVQTEAPLELDLAFWTRPLGTIGDTVQALATLAQVNWRVLSNGTVRIRAEDPFTVEPDAVEISRDDARGVVEVAPEFAYIQPGTLLGEDSIGDVIYSFGEGGLRCRYYTQQRAKLRGGLERLIRWVMRDAFYLGQFTCQVISQAADGTLDLMPDDSRLRAQGLQSVPIRHGLPGTTVRVASGARVLLGFDGGDPRQPYAALWHEGAVLEVAIGGALPVAIAQLVDAQLSALKAAITAAAATEAGASGLGGMTALNGSLSAWPLAAGTSSLILKSS